MPLRFQWDHRKAKANLRKHGVSFDDAKTAFDDPLFVVFFDPDHSIEENRFILLGEPSGDGSWWSLTRNGRRPFA